MSRFALVFVIACAAARPPLTYPVPARVDTLVTDDAAFARFAGQLRDDLATDLARPSPREKDERFVIAMLDALDGRWRDANAELARARRLERDPTAYAMYGLTIRVWAGAGGDPAAFRASLERELAALPIDLVRSELEQLRTMAQVFTPQVCAQLIAAAVGPNVHAGAIGFDDAQAVVFQHYAVKRLVPVAATIDAVLGAHGIAAKTE
ncbi:MAG TPA: hypothetical protein VGL61_25500 [Kofleriaceae bacterium]|jgi:hypothetical protein